MDRKQRGRGAARGQGAARAREMGLLIDFAPGGMMMGSAAADDVENDADLEAELLALTGGKPPGGREKPKGKDPLPMEHIERMAAMCMKDLDEEDGEDDEDLENDDDLLAELDDVLGEDDAAVPSKPTASQLSSAPAASGSLESTVLERLDMYKTAISNAKQAGESSKIRRYERGLKTIESMLVSVRKGKPINEDELPPPVAVGKIRGADETPEALQETLVDPARNAAPSHQVNSHSSLPADPPVPVKRPPAVLLKAKLPPPVPAKPVEPPAEIPTPAAPRPSSASSGSQDSSTKALLLGRQREYKLAALNAKQQGDTEMATQYYRIAKGMDSMLTALEQGETVDLGSMPPLPDQLPKQKLSPSPQHSVPSPTAVIPAGSAAPPDVSGIPPPPRDMLEAMQQRMDRYKTAAAQAKEKGDDRKARMHERIVKQYQDAIRSHKAGKTVDFSELPVPPGFPPLQGMEHPAGDQSIAGVLESAMKLARQDDHNDDDVEEDTEGTQKRGGHLVPGRPAPAVRPSPVPSNRSAQEATTPPGSAKPSPKVSTKAQQQLDFLEGRKKQLMRAALRAKQKNDMEGAKQFLRQAKGLDPMIEASQSGLPVDISKVPQAPVNAEDFTLAPRRGSNVTAKTTAQYTDLMELLKQQHEMCMSYSKQFTHLGNITETTKFEKMAADCKKNIEILKQAHAKGFPLPKFHYEERTFNIVKIFPDLNTNDMVLIVVKGINLPAPPGSSPNDLDSYVRFEFPYPNMEEAQRDKTNVIKSTNGPVFKEQFKLFINRGHRGLKRAIQAKGIKFEVIHKGGLFKQDRIVGTAQLKLDALETHCEIREIIELLDGRRPTGGKLEVIVRIREPLTSQQLDKVTEKWLVIEPLSMPPVALPKPKEKPPVMKEVGNRAGYTLQSLHVLAFERERLEKKIHHYKQMQSQPPNELLDQHQDIIQRFQWQKAHLEQGGLAARKEYVTQLERFLQLYTEAAQRLGHEGKRDAAKEALFKRNLVENELQRFRR